MSEHSEWVLQLCTVMQFSSYLSLLSCHSACLCWKFTNNSSYLFWTVLFSNMHLCKCNYCLNEVSDDKAVSERIFHRHAKNSSHINHSHQFKKTCYCYFHSISHCLTWSAYYWHWRDFKSQYSSDLSEASSLKSVSEVIQSDNFSSDHDMISLSGSLSSVSVFDGNHHSFIMHEQEDSISEFIEHISPPLNSDSNLPPNSDSNLLLNSNSDSHPNSDSDDSNFNSDDNNIMQHSAYEISDSFSPPEGQLDSDAG